uniref:Uncharacterized protein n=1 Tax=Anopheles culicifacies TaxID=139723 RepID=A0A182LWM6_9DIPT
MSTNQKLSLVEFQKKLSKYCSSGADCAVQEEDLLSRLEKLIVQRDDCLAQMIKKKEAETACSEDISGLEHQLAELVELLENTEKKCNLLALEQVSIDAEERPARQTTQQDTLQPALIHSSNELNEQ